jgi:protein NrfD
MTTPPSVFFTAPPEWRWLVIGYFFVGGLAGGAYFLAVLIDLLGDPLDRRLARVGYYIALPAVVLGGIFLVLDLRRPLRFWHMLLASNTLRPIFKTWSPMSVGAWALLVFGAFALVGFLAALAEADRLGWRWLRPLRPPAPLGTAIGIVGALLGLYVAGYTGVLLTVTNRPIWANTPLLGFLFIVSSASIAAALMLLVARPRVAPTPGQLALQRFNRWVIVLEFLVLVAFLASLGAVFRVWLSWWGLALLIGVFVIGMLLPWLIERRPRRGLAGVPLAAILVLVGGFVLRAVIVLASEGL